MADNRSIVITLILDKNSTSNDTAVSNQTDSSKVSTSTDNDSKAKAAGWALTSQAIATSASEVISWAEYYWDRELMLNDDYVGQRNKRIALTQINRGIGFVSSAISSAASGAALGGPIGAAIGAAIGIATSVAGIVRSNVQGQQLQGDSIRQMNEQLSFTRSRVGWSTHAGSIGEDL